VASEEKAGTFIDSVFGGLGAGEVECAPEHPVMKDGGVRRCAEIDVDARSLKKSWQKISGDLSAIAEPTSSWISADPLLKRYYGVDQVPIRASFDKEVRRLTVTYWPAFPVCGNPALETDASSPDRTDVVGAETPATTPVMAGVGNTTHPERQRYVRYPAHRRPAHPGKMTMQAVVLKDGSVGDVCILQATLPEAEVQLVAVDTVRKWRYEPALMDGNPVDAFITVRMNFEQ